MSQKKLPFLWKYKIPDATDRTFPGYSAIGRLRGLAEIRGVELGVLGSLMEK